MANFRTLTDAVIALKEYHSATDRDELLAEAVATVATTSENEKFLYSLLMNFVDGGTRVSQIIKSLNDRVSGDAGGSDKVSSEEIEKLLAIYYDAADPESIGVAGSIQSMTQEAPLGTPSLPTKNSSTVAIIQVLSANITPANRFTDAAALLLTAVPTAEWSRSIPVIDLNLILPRPPLNTAGRPEALSIFKFLVGGTTVSDTTEQDIINAGSVVQTTLDENGVTVTTPPFTSSGVELFTAPQTLVNADEDFGTVNYRSAPIIDKFRPLMTFKSLDLSVAPTFGMMSYKSGKLNFVLHDRSRLSEVADLVRPDLYSAVELLIEYGWSHPDGSSDSDNLYGQLINSTRIKEKYGVANSSFIFTDSGQIEITLEIFMKGVTDFSTTKITQNRDVINQIQGIEKLLDAVSEIKSASAQTAGTREVRGAALLDTPSDISDAMTFDEDALKAITNFITANTKSDDVPGTEELRSVLIDLYGTDGTDGKINDLKKTAKTSFDDKIKCFETGDDFPLLALPESMIEKYTNPPRQPTAIVSDTRTSNGDIQAQIDEVYNDLAEEQSALIAEIQIRRVGGRSWGFSLNDYDEDQSQLETDYENQIKYFEEQMLLNQLDATAVINVLNARAEDESAAQDREYFKLQAAAAYTNASNGGKYMSFAKLLLRFVAEPLASTAKFDEVQLLFYTFNSGAGKVRNSNIGSFPIRRTKFFKAFQDYTEERGTFNITIREFIEYVANNFIEDQTSQAYGMSTLYESSETYNEEGELEPPDPKNETALNSSIEMAMIDLNISDGVFRMPQISMYVEAIPLGEGDENATDPNGDTSVSLLRVHVFDKSASSHMPLQKLLDAMLDKNLGTFGESESEDKSGYSEKAAEILSQAAAAELIKPVVSNIDGKTTYAMTEFATPAAIKDFVSKSAPTLRYGTMATGINTIKVSSLQEPLLNTIHMQRAGLGDPSQAPGTDGGIVPLQMLPTEMTMETFGCPLINFGQQFFIDMDTGTTVDNIYGVVGLSHHLEQGQFKSSFKMINIDAYGKYRSAINAIKSAIDYIDQANGEDDPAPASNPGATNTETFKQIGPGGEGFSATN
jgi:hypothetical protein